MPSEYKTGALMMNALVAAAVLVTAVPAQAQFGAGKFKIEQSDDRFAGDGLTTFTGRHNRLSNRSVTGGVYIDGKGVYLDPMVIKSRADGKVERVGFVIYNDTEQDSKFGSLLLFGGFRKISFLLDGGKLISAEIKDSAAQTTGGASFNRYTGSASANVRESGTITISLENMAALAAAHTVAVQLQGGERSQTFEANQISKQFLSNLAVFYREQIKG